MTKAQTIFALSSGQGRAGVAVIRISGSGAGAVLDRMAAPRPKPRVAAFRKITHPSHGSLLDEGLALFFESPRTETGEDLAELQVHGGRAVVRAVLDALSEIPGCRMAEPGEFARRAFANGKLDLAQVEGLRDLIDAETEGQRRQALSEARGELSALYEDWRARLVEALALVEAALDFSDEGDVGTKAFEAARHRVDKLQPEIAAYLDDGHRGEILRDGFRVVLAGPPNVGKSSLLNALARRDVAIVSEEPGTTRDVIEVRLDLGGVPVIVTDTAGVRETAAIIEREGIRRSFEQMRDADLVLWMTTAGVTSDKSGEPPPMADDAPPMTILVNKVDLGATSTSTMLPPVSAKTGAGIAELLGHIQSLAHAAAGTGETVVVSQARHRHLLAQCLAHLETFAQNSANDTELRAEDLRAAAQALGRITGRVDVEDVLDHLFSRFCIGK